MFKKYNLFAIIAVLVALLLTACSGNNDTSSEPKEKEKKKEDEPQVEIIVSAAASLTDVAEEIKAKFNEKNPNITVTYNFGSSGKLSQQIQQGAPADIFLSASKKDMDFLAENKLIVEDSRFDFAGNELVVITEKSKELELAKLEDIATLDVKNIVMGDTEATPLGRYGKEALQTLGVWDKIESKMVYMSDVNQVLTHVETQNAEIGIVFNTDAQRAENVKILTKIDKSLHAPVIYPAAAINTSKAQEAAQLYLDFLGSDEGKSILEAKGFLVN